MMRTVKRVVKLNLSIVLVVAILLLSCGCSYFLDAIVAKKHNYVPVNSPKELYDQFFECVYHFEPAMYVKTDSYSTFSEYWDQLLDDFVLNSVFRVSTGQILYRDTKDGCCVEFDIQYNACGQAMQYLYAKNVEDYPTPEARKVGERLVEIVDTLITDGLSDQEKVKKLHDYIITHSQYAIHGDFETYCTAETLLFNGSAQCMGYTEAFTALCLLAGVECRVITGSSSFGYSEDGHAWCQVCISSIWYHIDVTWDDPIPDIPSLVSYSYYLKSDWTMSLTHSWANYFEECIVDYVT